MFKINLSTEIKIKNIYKDYYINQSEYLKDKCFIILLKLKNNLNIKYEWSEFNKNIGAYVISDKIENSSLDNNLIVFDINKNNFFKEITNIIDTIKNNKKNNISFVMKMDLNLIKLLKNIYYELPHRVDENIFDDNGDYVSLIKKYFKQEYSKQELKQCINFLNDYCFQYKKIITDNKQWYIKQEFFLENQLSLTTIIKYLSSDVLLQEFQEENTNILKKYIRDNLTNEKLKNITYLKSWSLLDSKLEEEDICLKEIDSINFLIEDLEIKKKKEIIKLIFKKCPDLKMTKAKSVKMYFKILKSLDLNFFEKQYVEFLNSRVDNAGVNYNKIKEISEGLFNNDELIKYEYLLKEKLPSLYKNYNDDIMSKNLIIDEKKLTTKIFFLNIKSVYEKDPSNSIFRVYNTQFKIVSKELINLLGGTVLLEDIVIEKNKKEFVVDSYKYYVTGDDIFWEKYKDKDFVNIFNIVHDLVKDSKFMLEKDNKLKHIARDIELTKKIIDKNNSTNVKMKI